jgi:formate hydrogenlyase subunit 6/NADH:ubiquinone oxidoreductase subunit I
MAHGNVKDVYRKLGKKIDSLPTRAPWNEAFYEILKELYTPQEAEVLVTMPYGLASFERVARCTKKDHPQLRLILDSLCEKGLVFDVKVKDKYFYMPAPLAVGIFEMTMMRTRGDLKSAAWARLFHEYMQGTSAFYEANFKDGKRVSVMRTLPHVEAIGEAEVVEILDYEKAAAIVENADRFAIGLCSCRHEKFHLGEKSCQTPLDTCMSFGSGADALVSHGFAKEASRTEILENVARSKEFKLVLTADNVKEDVGFICQCCGCCCNLMLGITRHGYPNTIVTSTYISQVDTSNCTACEKCARACPINAIEMVPILQPLTKKTKDPRVDETICLGCGVCALVCHKNAVKLVKRDQRVLHPETTIHRVILQSLERGTLQYQLFDDPQSVSQQFLRGFVGAFLRLPPVKKALLSEQFQSRFLAVLESAA